MMMVSSVVIPQDIIDSIIAAIQVDCYDESRSSLLKTCALVSSSFLLPSRKRLFSKIHLGVGFGDDQHFWRLHAFLVRNPVAQTFVRSISISLDWGFSKSLKSLVAILRLSFCCLESLSIHFWCRYFNWNDFSSELKDALSTVIHSPTLKTLYFGGVKIPIGLLQGHLTKLVLSSISPLFDLDSKQSRLPALTASLVDHCQWWFFDKVYELSYTRLLFLISNKALTEPIFLPFMCCLRVFEIIVCPDSATMSDFNVLSFMIRSLRVSLSSPATLEHLKFDITFQGNSNRFDCDAFFYDLRHADVWNHLDSFITHPTGSRLQRVDIDISYHFRYNNNVIDPDESEVVEPILDALPLLRKKGIRFVDAVNSGPWPWSG